MDAALAPLQLLGFLLASWAVIGNDSLQTLGPFLQANRGRTPRWLQALFLCAVLCIVLLLGWWRGGGDASWGRLAAYPPQALFGWPELLPPLAVLLLTQAGVPVSTSFLVLTAFTPANLPALLRRSLLGYGLALAVGLLVYGALSLGRRCQATGPARQAGARPEAIQTTEPPPSPPESPLPPVSGSRPVAQRSSQPPSQSASRSAAQPPRDSQEELSASDSTPPQGAQPGASRPLASGRALLELHSFSGEADGRITALALALLWLASAWLWSQWLIQDLANLFIYLPRRLGAGTLALALLVLCAGVCLLLAESGGALQDIVRRKSGLQTPLASAGLSLVYGLILALLAVWGRDPLSTTWVFLGLLAGRELALLLEPEPRPLASLALDLGRDLALASLGLVVSVALALALQPLRGVG